MQHVSLGELVINQCSSKKKTQSAGFEPARAEPNGFLVHLRNHLDTTADIFLQNYYNVMRENVTKKKKRPKKKILSAGIEPATAR